MRQLVTVQKIHNIRPIEGRDRVDVASVLGWEVIVGKGVYQENEYVCFAEIDSVFPKHEIFSDLERFKYRIKSFKVNTKDGAIYGQGYCLPLTILEHFDKEYPREYQIGEDITDLIGVVKYEPPIDYSEGDSKGTFPTKFIPKTDETRLQSKLEVLDELKGKPYVIRQKADGQSSTFLIAPDTNEYLVCSRSLSKKSPEESGKESTFWTVSKKYDIEKMLREYPDYAIQGEIVGGKIQGNKMGINGLELRVFNIYKLSERRYLNHDEFESMFEKFKTISPKLEQCKIIEIGDNFNHTYESLLELAIHKYDSGKWAEGIVIRSQIEQYSLALKESRLSFKLINPEFLCSGGN